jgi:signal transduction histidine kinase
VESAVPATPADHRVRPLLWRLPLIAFIAIGALSLHYLDRLIVREYRTGAITQAVQADALLQGFVRNRVASLRGLEVLVAEAGSADEGARRFRAVARELGGTGPEVFAVFHLDSAGRVLDAFPRTTRDDLARTLAAEAAARGALARAGRSARTAVAPSLTLGGAGQGLLLVDPVIAGGRVQGFVGEAFAFRSLFSDALGGQLQGTFDYRVSDALGNVIARSPEWPRVSSEFVRRDVSLPGGQRWLLEVAIPRWQPITPRAITWCVGALLLLLVVLMVHREEARAERLAIHSLNLELLSRDLLDANVRLEERAQQVAEANRAKSRFLANVSHELRTPLNAIVGYNSLALDGVYGELVEPLREAHARIHAAGEHLLALVNDVLDLSKIEVGRMEVEAEPMDVASLVDGVATVVEPIAAAKGVRLDVVVARDLPRIVSDARHARQVLLNLVANAIKFTERGSVAVVARRDDAEPDQRVAMVVEDTGIGIAEHDLERIFEEFEQVRSDGRGDSLRRGTGLGLTIARKLARLLGGDVTVQSRVGAGSRFTFVLPVFPPRGVPDTAELPRPSRPPATSLGAAATDAAAAASLDVSPSSG